MKENIFTREMSRIFLQLFSLDLPSCVSDDFFVLGDISVQQPRQQLEIPTTAAIVMMMRNNFLFAERGERVSKVYFRPADSSLFLHETLDSSAATFFFE